MFRWMILLTLMAGIVMPAPAQSSKEAQRQFTFAYRLLERGEPDLAIEAFEDFIRDFPNTPLASDAAYYLALSAQQQGQVGTAKKWLDTIKETQHVPMLAVHLLNGQVQIQAKDFATAIKSLESIKAESIDDKSTYATWRYLRGVAYEGVTRFEDAANEFEQAAQSESPIRQSALYEAGKLHAKMNKVGPAIEHLVQAAQINTASALAPDAYKLAGDLAYHAGQFAQAATLYQDLLTKYPNSAYLEKASIARLRSLLGAEQFGPVVEQYPVLQKKISSEHQAEALYILGAAYVRLKQYEEGIPALRTFYRNYTLKHALGRDVAYLLAIAYYHTSIENFNQWMTELDAQMPNLPGRLELRYLQAQAALKQEDWKGALGHFSALVDEPSGLYAKNALLERAKVYEQLQQNEKAAADYATYVKRFGEDPAAPSAARRSIDLAFAMNRYSEVKKLSEQWLTTHTEDADTPLVQFKLAVALMKLNQAPEAEALLEDLSTKKLPGGLNALVTYYRGILLASRGTLGLEQDTPTASQVEKITRATELIHQAIEQKLPETQTIEGWALLADLYRLLDKESDAVQAFEQLRSRRSVDRFDPPTAIWVGRRLLQDGHVNEARIWFSAVQAREDISPTIQSEVLFRLALCDQREKKWDMAAQKFQQVVALSQAYGDQGRLGLAQCLRAKGQFDEALAEYEGLINAKSSRVAATALFESALVYRELALRYQKQGNTDVAERLLKQSLKWLHRVDILYQMPELSPIPQRTLYALAQTHEMRNEPEKTKKYYERLAKDYPGDDYGQLGKAHMMNLEGKRSQAVFLLRTINEKTKDDQVREHAQDALRRFGESS